MTHPAETTPLSPSPLLGDLPVKEIVGVPVHAIRFDNAIELCLTAVRERTRLRIGVVNAAKIVNMKSDPMLAQSVLESDLILADGMSVVTASRLLGTPLPERVTGIDLFEQLLAAAERENRSVFLLGAKPEVLEAVQDRIQREHPRLRIAGVRDGYFDETEEPEIAAQIAAASADFLFIAITSPKKEIFMQRWEDTISVPVVHGVGGSFDVYSGMTPRAPKLWQRMGVEWLYRLCQEPRRMWRRYLVTNSLFVMHLLGAMFRSRFLAR